MPTHRLTLPVLVAAALTAIGAGSFQSADEPDPRFTTLARQALATLDGELRAPGLRQAVEVIRDRWGVPHIYAQNTSDLFFAQGFVMAQDRLWQMEMWRRQREGRLAEILGPQAVERDRIARLLRYRGPLDDREWQVYHPEGRQIFEAFAAGVNAFIDSHRQRLPVEFVLTGIVPSPWTAETVVLRSATFGHASSELQLAQSVARLGVEEANRRADPDPFDALVVPTGTDVAIIDDGVVASTRGGRGAVRPDLAEPYRSWRGGAGPGRGRGGNASTISDPPGSNNWVIGGALSATGKPVVANDPHREVSNPSLRAIVHLSAPGWNVIGAVEAPFVGVAIGHNDRVAWGLTIVGTDQEDVYVERVNPADPNQVAWQGGWEPLRVVRESIGVKGGPPTTVALEYSRHGPIFHRDPSRGRAYALRSALLEPGGASYLAGLRLSQARDCLQFLDAAMYWYAPSENLICGDVDGNISWQASALTPDRGQAWRGRLPVPGDGTYEWRGFRNDLPRETNPARGFIATANHNVQPKGYAPPFMFKTAGNVSFERITRLLQMIQPGRTYTLEDHRRMQGDALHLRARSELDLFRGWTSSTPSVERARTMLAAWDAVLTRDSGAAALYSAWRSASSPEERIGTRPASERAPLHEASLNRAIATLTSQMGTGWTGWRWGRMHTRAFPHPLVSAFDLATVERPGGTGTVAADGASYREILDVADWDRSIATNTPGQSAQPESPYYANLLPLWARDEYFPLAFSRKRVEEVAAHRLRLR